MSRLLLLVFLMGIITDCYSQQGYLFVKRGLAKKRTYMEGSTIALKLQNNKIASGVITQLRNDTIFLNGIPIPKENVAAVILRGKKPKRMRINAKYLLLVTSGVILTTVGIKVSGQGTLKEAAVAGVVIGYGQMGLAYARSRISLSRKQFKIGRKFRLQMIDFHISPTRVRAF
jgi:hypothetical protein